MISLDIRSSFEISLFLSIRDRWGDLLFAFWNWLTPESDFFNTPFFGLIYFLDLFTLLFGIDLFALSSLVYLLLGSLLDLEEIRFELDLIFCDEGVGTFWDLGSWI